ncbi:hypothetical protein HaLaN_28229 [Haematococcus lacustris]|uniref:Uncharacterized protein n=1 Tax=Haematococcus lacustris TaxID=44745 RepID=A0A6A0AAA6_HAELA|nr:hypothetical protein HaLaN_28229 [Haematococcus lacustris]
MSQSASSHNLKARQPGQRTRSPHLIVSSHYSFHAQSPSLVRSAPRQPSPEAVQLPARCCLGCWCGGLVAATIPGSAVLATAQVAAVGALGRRVQSVSSCATGWLRIGQVIELGGWAAPWQSCAAHWRTQVFSSRRATV